MLRQEDLTSLQNLLSDHSYLLLVVTFLVMIVQNLATFVPLLIVVTINITFFGFVFGYLWSVFTSVIGACLCFWLARYLFQEWFLQKVNQQILDKMEGNAFLYIFISRNVLFVPTSVINIAAGVSSIKFHSYFYGTLLGNSLYLLVLSFIPLGLMNLEIQTVVYGFLLVVLVLVPIFYWRGKKRGKQQTARVRR
ncbi:TVP38/TMEM64 family protein [Desertibacillus haloalkaliphilus]|uniref:TVP38/TMEM64 family protein n=1 Tax=Desertibacillus haloalkaliphilus TaxID=1328930 RepID=UPI001C269FC3|nr:VTT domain-containing protein [Desertibacillus haloalkaliphilus]MBU8907961.1 VTT domain-containing protein [Desertibacillus haloalkaliphilus]